MKVIVLYDKKGQIISIGAPPETVSAASPAAFGARSGDGQHVGEFEVSTEHEALSLQHLAERLQIDVSSTTHRLARKP